MSKNWRWAFGGILLSLVGCVSLQSGHYVEVLPGEGSKVLARKFSVDEKKLKLYNPRSQFRPGEMIFIPLERGFLSRDTRRFPAGSFEEGNFLWPVPSSKRISSKFGRRWGRNHNGIDITAPSGTPIVAVEAGQVIYSGRRLGSFGNMVVIRHGGGYYSLYAHNKVNYVRRGDTVERGETIGEVGNTGRSSGNHLHFEIRKKDRPINPLTLYKRGGKKYYAQAQNLSH